VSNAPPSIAPLEPYLARPHFTLTAADKQKLLLQDLNALTDYHVSRSAAYARLLRRLWNAGPASRLEEIPWIPVSLFKSHALQSVAREQISTTLTSSGTTGQAASRIAVDGVTADRQARALVSTLQHAFGSSRLPMILVDSRSTIRDPRMMSARGAGVLGMMRFGREHFFALDDDMVLDLDGLRAFLERHGARPFAIFGFTFMVWRYFLRQLEDRGSFDLSNGILVHSGGWKKLEEEAVDNATFRNRFLSRVGVRRIFNFYGMVEQIGSIFLEGEDGLLYPPNFSEVCVRNPRTWEPAGLGEAGVIQVLSAIPLSYPGHSLLTEDLGVVEHVDMPAVSGRLGRAFRVLGRAPRSELRGCSDVHAYAHRGA